MSENKNQQKRFTDVSEQLIHDLNAIDNAKTNTSVIGKEKDFPKSSLPIEYKGVIEGYIWDESEVRKFFENPENVARTIFCKEINKDETDFSGWFGKTQAFVFIKGKNYDGSKTYADDAVKSGLSIGVDPTTGLGLMNSFDYFPIYKFDYQVIRNSEFPELFGLLCDIFTKKKVATDKEEVKPLIGDTEKTT